MENSFIVEILYIEWHVSLFMHLYILKTIHLKIVLFSLEIGDLFSNKINCITQCLHFFHANLYKYADWNFVNIWRHSFSNIFYFRNWNAYSGFQDYFHLRDYMLPSVKVEGQQKTCIRKHAWMSITWKVLKWPYSAFTS